MSRRKRVKMLVEVSVPSRLPGGEPGDTAAEVRSTVRDHLRSTLNLDIDYMTFISVKPAPRKVQP